MNDKPKAARTRPSNLLIGGLPSREERLESALLLALNWIPTEDMIERAEPKAEIKLIWDTARDLGLVE